jgi:hypothetical protein
MRTQLRRFMLSAMTIRYDRKHIEPLLVRSRVDGTEMEYVFRCPDSGTEIAGRAPIPGYGGMTAGDYVRGTAGASARSGAAEAAGRVVPGGEVIATLAENVLWFRRSKRKREQAAAQVPDQAFELLVTAFRSVEDRFRWDEQRGGWVAREKNQGANPDAR